MPPLSSLSTGVDIATVSRIRTLSDNPAFLKKVFTQGEMACVAGKKRSDALLAGRFAAKEAVMKALGSGWGKIGWKDIEVLNDGNAPKAVLHSEALKRLGTRKVFLSISHAGDVATAMAVIE